jgi:hypothetical protein
VVVFSPPRDPISRIVSSYWYEGRVLTRDKRMQRLDDDPPARGHSRSLMITRAVVYPDGNRWSLVRNHGSWWCLGLAGIRSAAS